MKNNRRYLPNDLQITNWEVLLPFFDELKSREINSKEEFKNFLLDLSEVEAVVSEDAGWRYIKMTINTADEEAQKSYQTFVTEISPKIAPYSNVLNQKIFNSPFKKDLTEDGFDIYLRSIEKSIKLYREKNIPLSSEERTKAQEFGTVSGAQSVVYNDEEKTIQQASIHLKSKDRAERKEVFDLIINRRAEDVEGLNKIFSELLELRHQQAVNADFENYRDYKFEALGRFDYTKEDCFSFHDAIANEIVPVCGEFTEEHREELGLEELHPYDSAAEAHDKPLKPFSDARELIDNTISMFNRIDPFFGNCIKTMDEMGHLDLESKKGKSPGGYNYPLYETGIPFIFMNSVGLQRDLTTMVHEGGHAIHSVLTKSLPMTSFKSCPSEVAELASMSMELISMDYWDEFYTDKEELKRAKKEQLKGTLEALPWIATIDKFQHWVYENPNHSLEERTENWLKIQQEFSTNKVNWSGYEKAKEVMWQRQLHLFEVPFYYIEYGFAQLGAIALWKNFKENKQKGIEQYKAALSLGYTKSIPEIYKTAGIQFNFSKEYVKELADFVKEELGKV